MANQKYNAVIMHAKDNVATAVIDLKDKQLAVIKMGEEKEKQVHVLEDIRFGHKLALTFIHKGDPVIKYGETIGIANQEIQAGQHVHVHNIDSVRGKGRVLENEI